MNRDYVTGRIKTIISSFVGIYPEDVDMDMSFADFNIGKYDLIDLLDNISEEFDLDCEYHEITPELSISDIIDKIM